MKQPLETTILLPYYQFEEMSLMLFFNLKLGFNKELCHYFAFLCVYIGNYLTNQLLSDWALCFQKVHWWKDTLSHNLQSRAYILYDDSSMEFIAICLVNIYLICNM